MKNKQSVKLILRVLGIFIVFLFLLSVFHFVYPGLYGIYVFLMPKTWTRSSLLASIKSSDYRLKAVASGELMSQGLVALPDVLAALDKSSSAKEKSQLLFIVDVIVIRNDIKFKSDNFGLCKQLDSLLFDTNSHVQVSAARTYWRVTNDNNKVMPLLISEVTKIHLTPKTAEIALEVLLMIGPDAHDRLKSLASKLPPTLRSSIGAMMIELQIQKLYRQQRRQHREYTSQMHDAIREQAKKIVASYGF